MGTLLQTLSMGGFFFMITLYFGLLLSFPITDVVRYALGIGLVFSAIGFYIAFRTLQIDETAIRRKLMNEIRRKQKEES